ncbi:MAG: hypothetical protein V1495_09440 [Pseudomonadota bacterium]
MKRFVYLVVVAVLAVFFAACKDDRICGTPGTFPGFSLSPVGFPVSYDKLGAFFIDTRTLGVGNLLWKGPWRDDAADGSDAGNVPARATQLSQQGKTDCFATEFVFQWRSGSALWIGVPSNTSQDWRNIEAKNRFLQMLRMFVSVERPSILFLGNENDFYYEQDLLDYANWLQFYNDTYDELKKILPGVSIGPVFNFEHLSGSGTLRGWIRPFWEAFDHHDFKRVDVVGLTVYPFFKYPIPSEIPATYLDSFVKRLTDAATAAKRTISLAITETGWPAENLGDPNPPWVASAQQQTNYIPKFVDMIQGKQLLFYNWLFLYAMADDGSADWKTFGSISLHDSAGIKRQAYDIWYDTWRPK